MRVQGNPHLRVFVGVLGLHMIFWEPAREYEFEKKRLCEDGACYFVCNSC